MQIDIISDTVCPWCFIGKRRLETALAQRPSIRFDIHWKPFRLDPTVPPDGFDRRTYMRAKFGDSPRVAAMGEALRLAGESERIAFDFDRIERRPSTTDSHRLIRWAGEAGVQGKIVEHLFRAYFEQGRDIGDAQELAAIADDAGMDAALISQWIDSPKDIEVIEQEDALVHDMGISGVPTFIFASRFALSGAQDPAMLLRVIDRASQMATEAV